MLKFPTPPSVFIRYANAVLIVLLAFILAVVLRPVAGGSPFAFFVGAVAISAWYGGLGPGLAASVLSVLLIHILLLPAELPAALLGIRLLQIGSFGFIAFLINWLETRRRQYLVELHRTRDELRIILDGVADGISVQDTTGKLIFANEAAAAFSGYPSKTAMLHTPVEAMRDKLRMLDENGSPMPVDALPRARVFAERRSVSMNFIMRNIDTNEDRWMQLSASPIFDEKGEVVQVVNIFRDATDQAKIEQERAELAAIINNSEDAILSKTIDGVIARWNPGAERLYGYTAEEAVGQPIWMLFAEQNKEREMAVLERLRRGERIHHYETQRRRKDGSLAEVSMTISPVRNQRGELTGMSSIARDISHRRSLDRARDENMRFLRGILNALPMLVGVMTPDGVLIEANRAALDVASLSAGELIGLPLDRIAWWSYSERARDQLREAIRRARQGEIIRYDTRIQVSADQFMTIDFMISPMFDSNNKITHLIPAATDITERKRREEEILRLTMLFESQRRRFDTIIANLPGIVYEGYNNLDTGEHHVEFVSQYAVRMLGYPEDTWKESPDFWRKIIHPDDWNHWSQEVSAIGEDDDTETIQARCLTSEGQIIHTEAHFAAIKDNTRGRMIICGVVMDISARKEFELELAEYNEALQRSNAELEQFAYVASHDLQEPLRTVTSYLQLIDQRYDERLDSDGKDFINFAVNGAARMKTLINDLLTYSRLQREHSEFAPVSMEAVLEQVLYDLQIAIEDSGAVITHEPLPTITANEGQMTQLLQNLLANAIKFRRDEALKIDIGAKREKGEWVFWVCDNGIGIDPTFSDRIFDIFQRLHPVDRYPGTGIGLAICRRIVQDHYGRIWFESEPGMGTTFYFSIPATLTRRKRFHGSR